MWWYRIAFGKCGIRLWSGAVTQISQTKQKMQKIKQNQRFVLRFEGIVRRLLSGKRTCGSNGERNKLKWRDQ